MYDINIPPSARYDSDAPFNEVDYGHCDACLGLGVDTDNEGELVDCEVCEGTGKKTEEQARDAYESYLEDMNER